MGNVNKPTTDDEETASGNCFNKSNGSKDNQKVAGKANEVKKQTFSYLELVETIFDTIEHYYDVPSVLIDIIVAFLPRAKFVDEYEPAPSLNETYFINFLVQSYHDSLVSHIANILEKFAIYQCSICQQALNYKTSMKNDNVSGDNLFHFDKSVWPCKMGQDCKTKLKMRENEESRYHTSINYYHCNSTNHDEIICEECMENIVSSVQWSELHNGNRALAYYNRVRTRLCLEFTQQWLRVVCNVASDADGFDTMKEGKHLPLMRRNQFIIIAGDFVSVNGTQIQFKKGIWREDGFLKTEFKTKVLPKIQNEFALYLLHIDKKNLPLTNQEKKYMMDEIGKDAQYAELVKLNRVRLYACNINDAKDVVATIIDIIGDYMSILTPSQLADLTPMGASKSVGAKTKK